MGNTEKFNLMADRYDTAERMEIAKICSDAIRNCVTDTHRKKVVDFGCGTGLVGMNLLELFHCVLFIDSSPNMIDIVRNKIDALHVKNADVLCCDLEIDDIENISADYIIMVQTLLHIKDTEGILSTLCKHLKKDGHLIIIDFDKNNAISSEEVHNGFEQKTLQNTAKTIGFSSADSKTFYYGKKLFMNHDASLFIMDCKKDLEY